MAVGNFDRCLKRVLRDEGGYSNDAGDPGGATMWGITHIDYDAYRRRRGERPQDVRKMTTAERDDIYRGKYWDGSRCDELPAGLDYVVFDGSVNSGVSQSIKWLQRAVGGIAVDGHPGDVTITAARRVPPETLIRSVCDQRLRFLRNLRTFKLFGRGWSRRVASVEHLALVDAGEDSDHVDHIPREGGAKAKVADISEPIVSQETAAGTTAASATTAGIVSQVQQQLSPFSDTLDVIKWLLLAVAIVGLGLTIYAAVKSRQVKDVT